MGARLLGLLVVVCGVMSFCSGCAPSQASGESEVVMQQTDAIERGRELFEKSPKISCRGCHSLRAGEVLVGPSLAGIGRRLSPEKIRESIENPSAVIAPGFGTATVETTGGKMISGRLTANELAAVKLEVSSGEVITIPREEVESFTPGESDMPVGAAAQLSPRALEELVEFLASLQ